MVQPEYTGGDKMYRMCAPCRCYFEGQGFQGNPRCPTPAPVTVPAPGPGPAPQPGSRLCVSPDDLRKASTAGTTGCPGLPGNYMPVVDELACRRWAIAHGSSLPKPVDDTVRDCVNEYNDQHRMVSPDGKGGHDMYRICMPCECYFSHQTFRPNPRCPQPTPKP